MRDLHYKYLSINNFKKHKKFGLKVTLQGIYLYISQIMADKNLILKKSLQKIVKSAIKKDPILSEVYRVDITFLFRSPVMSAMCDWVYGMKIHTKSEFVDRIAISSRLKSKVSNTLSQVSNDSFCCTDVAFE